MKLVSAELKDRVQIAVKHDRDLRFLSDLANTIEHAANCCARGERALGRKLVYDSIRERVGERQSKLEQIGSGFFQRKGKIDRALQVWIAGANVGNETLALFRAEPRKTLVDPVVHFDPEIAQCFNTGSTWNPIAPSPVRDDRNLLSS